jgi:uncharacterized protein
MSQVFQPAAAEIVEQIAALVEPLTAGADVQDMGATAIPGLLTKGDVDVNVRVAAGDFAPLVEFLGRRFEINQPQNWTEGFASFADETNYALPVGVQVTILCHADDVYIAQRDRLAARPDLIAEYNQLKSGYEGSDMDDYRTAKWAFIDAHLSIS